jgi:TusA-related sulfurtransferase
MDARGVACTTTVQVEDSRPVEVAVLDCRGLLCPLPLLKTQQAVADLRAGQVLEVWTTDPQSESDLRAWAQAAGHHVTPLAPQDGVYRFHVRRGTPGR